MVPKHIVVAVLGISVGSWSRSSFAHGLDVVEAVIAALSLQLLIYGLIVQSLIVLVLLIAQKFGRKSVLGIVSAISGAILLLGSPALLAIVTNRMGGADTESLLICLLALFCLSTPVAQYLYLNRALHWRGK